MRAAARVLAALALLGAAACASLTVALTDKIALAAFEGKMLRASEAAGIDCLRAMGTVAPLQAWIEQQGSPDYMLVESRRRVLLFYIERDEVARFERPLVGGAFAGSASRPIRSDHYVDFANADRERLGLVRMGQGVAAESGRSEAVVRRRVGADDDEVEVTPVSSDPSRESFVCAYAGRPTREDLERSCERRVRR